MSEILYEITEAFIGSIKNKAFQDYVQSFLDDDRYFLESISRYGLPLEHPLPYAPGNDSGIITRNNGHSLYLNRISPACIACRGEAESATHFISMRCTRKCYYCFNTGNENYEYYLTHKRDYRKEFQLYREAGFSPAYIGLTGGEPLIHKEDAVAFFRLAKELFPGVHTRLYTCGDPLDAELLTALKAAGLDEIRVSVKLEDSAAAQAETLEKLALAKDYIPAVMVEMPVIPGSLEEMKDLLLKLDAIGIFGINLLEFCFPLTPSEEFNGFKIKNPPYQVLYHYGYGGGLPVAGSEEGCLALLDFAAERKMSIGVHYCSLENKFTGQIWAQNKAYSSRFTLRSEKDFFIKTAKVFGADIPKVQKRLKQGECLLLDDALLFHPDLIPTLRSERIEIGISLNVVEKEEGEEYLRELKILYTTPEQFDPCDL